MRQHRFTLISIICLLPLCALADHEEVLIPIYFQIFSIFAFLILLIVLKTNPRVKLILALTYLASLTLIVLLTKDMSYDLNKFVDISWAAGPAIITLFVFLVMKYRGTQHKKEK